MEAARAAMKTLGVSLALPPLVVAHDFASPDRGGRLALRLAT